MEKQELKTKIDSMDTKVSWEILGSEDCKKEETGIEENSNPFQMNSST